MQAKLAATLCSQLADILEAGAPTRLRVKQLKDIERAFRSDAGLRADARARLGQVIDGIEDYWTALETTRQARELDAVRYRAFSGLQSLEAALRRAPARTVPALPGPYPLAPADRRSAPLESGFSRPPRRPTPESRRPGTAFRDER